MKTIATICSVCGIGLVAMTVSAQTLCGTQASPPPSGAPELKLEESELTYENAAERIQFLKIDVPEMIETHHNKYPVTHFEGFYIGYPNSLMIVEGTLLKQRAEIARHTLQETKNSIEQGKTPQVGLKEAEEAFQKALGDLCRFLATSEYAD